MFVWFNQYAIEKTGENWYIFIDISNVSMTQLNLGGGTY